MPSIVYNKNVNKYENDLTFTMIGEYTTSCFFGDRNHAFVEGSHNRAFFNGSSNDVQVRGSDSGAEFYGQWNNVSVTGQGSYANIQGSNNNVTLLGILETAHVGGDDAKVRVDGERSNVSIETRARNSIVELNGKNDMAWVFGHEATITSNGEDGLVVLKAQSAGDSYITPFESDNHVMLRGARSQIWCEGNENWAELYGTEETAIVTGSNNVIDLKGHDNSATIAGIENTIRVNGANNHISVIGDNNTIAIAGANGTADVAGKNCSVNITGTNDFASFTGTGNSGVVFGANASLELGQSNSVMFANNWTNFLSLSTKVFGDVANIFCLSDSAKTIDVKNLGAGSTIYEVLGSTNVTIANNDDHHVAIKYVNSLSDMSSIAGYNSSFDQSYASVGVSIMDGADKALGSIWVTNSVLPA